MNIKILVAIATFTLSLVIAYPMMSFAQFEQKGNQSSSGSETGNQSSSGSQIEIPMNFTLKSKGGEKAKEGQENKTVTVNVAIGQGENGSPTTVPVTAEVPNNTKVQDMQLCSSMKEGKESCQSLKAFMPKESKTSSGSSEGSSNGSNNATDNKDKGGN
ncbi:MAG TPA: hypothetical protein VI146_01785 [Nitrososphaeraceae archaeon]